jgi:hypothetical protein
MITNPFRTPNKKSKAIWVIWYNKLIKYQKKAKIDGPKSKYEAKV